MSENWSHLEALEAESVYIIREVVAQFRNPVMLYSIGKDSSVMVHLARKAFYPGPIPFPLLHVDTGYKFKEMLQFRDEFTKAIGARLIVHRNEEAIAEGAHPLKLGVARCCGKLKTGALLQALEKYNFDAAIGGARRDEERSRAKERVFSFRDAFGQWDPRNQRAELWNLYNGEIHEGESMRVFPLSNWTERDVWQYIREQNIPIVPLYYAKQRQVVYRGTNWIPIDGPGDVREGETPVTEWVRFRTLGCAPCTGAVKSEATTIEGIVEEASIATRSERETRVIDHGANTMEDKKREGYF
jgi:sulfate adenylyltransferase subunit 2